MTTNKTEQTTPKTDNLLQELNHKVQLLETKINKQEQQFEQLNTIVKGLGETIEKPEPQHDTKQKSDKDNHHQDTAFTQKLFISDLELLNCLNNKGDSLIYPFEFALRYLDNSLPVEVTIVSPICNNQFYVELQNELDDKQTNSNINVSLVNVGQLTLLFSISGDVQSVVDFINAHLYFLSQPHYRLSVPLTAFGHNQFQQGGNPQQSILGSSNRKGNPFNNTPPNWLSRPPY